MIAFQVIRQMRRDEAIRRGKAVPSLEITPRMRSEILKGLPAYQRGGYARAEGGALPQIHHPRHARHLQEPQQPVPPIKLHTGPIHSAVAGRTDHLPTHVPSGSYVVPADIVSGLGEGNSLAGFRHIKRMFAELKRRYGGLPYSGDSCALWAAWRALRDAF